MKKSLLTIGILLSVFNVIAQTNFLKDTGNVGIGTLTPTQKLEIANNGPSYMQLTHKVDLMGTVGAIKFNMYGSEVSRIEAERTVAEGRQTALKFFVRSATGLPEAMRITETGRVGIGVPNPRYTLHSASYDNTSAAAALLWGEYYGAIAGVSSASPSYYALHVVSNVDSMAAGGTGGTKSLLYVRADGNVGIGTTNPQSKLAVNGDVFAKRVKVTLAQADWPDYVFAPGYSLPSLLEVERYVNSERHLPGIPNAAEVEKDGLDLGEMNKKLLEKIEELTLYLLQINRQNQELKGEIESMKSLYKRNISEASSTTL